MVTEIYDSGRFFALTGHHLEGTPATIERRPAQVLALYERLDPPRPAATVTVIPTERIADDDELIERSRNAAQRRQVRRGCSAATRATTARRTAARPVGRRPRALQHVRLLDRRRDADRSALPPVRPAARQVGAGGLPRAHHRAGACGSHRRLQRYAPHGGRLGVGGHSCATCGRAPTPAPPEDGYPRCADYDAVRAERDQLRAERRALLAVLENDGIPAAARIVGIRLAFELEPAASRGRPPAPSRSGTRRPMTPPRMRAAPRWAIARD